MNAVDETNLSDIMLTVGDPQEAVNYFSRTAAENPDRIDLQRGLAKSLIRNSQPAEAAKAWAKVITMPGATPDDKVGARRCADPLERLDRRQGDADHPAHARDLRALQARGAGRRQREELDQGGQLLRHRRRAGRRGRRC